MTSTTQPITSQEDVSALLAVCSHHVVRLMFCMGLYTAMRIGEILSLDWNDIVDSGLPRRTLKIYCSKQKKYRIIPVSVALAGEILDAYKIEAYKNRATGYVFKPRRSKQNKPMSYQGAHKIIEQTFIKSGIEVANPSSHTLRKTMAYNFFMAMRAAGKENALELTCAMLGHSSPAVTMRYIGLTWDLQKEGFDSISYVGSKKPDLVGRMKRKEVEWRGYAQYLKRFSANFETDMRHYLGGYSNIQEEITAAIQYIENELRFH